MHICMYVCMYICVYYHTQMVLPDWVQHCNYIVGVSWKLSSRGSLNLAKFLRAR